MVVGSQVMVYRFQPVLIIALRVIFGILFAGVFSMASIAVGWGLFVFSGSQSAQAWFILQLGAAGMGAGLGSFVAWFNIDRNTGLMMTLMVAVGVVGGLAGAWSGYEYGAYRTSLCCDKAGTTILLSPVTNSAIGATILANLAMLVFAFAKKTLTAQDRLSRRLPPLANGADATKYRSVNR